MKTNKFRCSPVSIAKTRWAAYAAASAATALAGSNSAEAAIHYSGILDVPFPTDSRICYTFPLDQPGDSFRLCHSTYDGYRNSGIFYPFGIGSAAVRGYVGSTGPVIVSQLHFGRRISSGPFVPYAGRFQHYYRSSQRADWGKAGGGFVGFRFNHGAGIQYGWVRIRVSGEPQNGNGFAFILHDYAYADPGEPLRAGQISSDNDAVKENSLGGLALGAVGLLAWRKSRTPPAQLW
jgi:hypothetical protein